MSNEKPEEKEMSPFDTWTSRAQRAVILVAAVTTLWGLVTGRIPDTIVSAREAFKIAQRLADEDVFKDIAEMQRGFIEIRNIQSAEITETSIWRRSLTDRLEKLTEQVMLVQEEQLAQAEQIEELSAPTHVFDINPSTSGPIDGFCVEDKPCRVALQLRRNRRAVECEFVPNTTRWGFYNQRTNLFVQAHRIDPPANRDIGTDWERLEVLIQTPPDLEPGAEFTFSTAYRNCPWMEDDEPPRVYTSPPLDFAIRAS